MIYKKGHTKIIAHRGASYLAHFENTIESFKLAIDLHADMVEFDVRETSDGELIVFHDSTFADAPISWQTYATIQAAAKTKGFQIPTLLEVLELCHGKIQMDIEIKETGFEKRLIEQVTSICDYNEFSIKSFKDKVCYRIKSLDENICTGLLVGHKEASLMQRLDEYFPVVRLKKCKADFISPHYLLATREFIARMKMHRYPVLVWTVNEVPIMEKLLRYKVEGIISDKPDAALYAKKRYIQMKIEEKSRFHKKAIKLGKLQEK